jgi:hypothetical protein
MTEEFNLSNLIFAYERYGDSNEVYIERLASDLKEFIKKLKEEVDNLTPRDFKMFIDKLAGDKLI